jgi:tetratricopeptide (TPR) repeat protein
MSQSRTTAVRWDDGALIGFIDSGIEHCRAGRWEQGAKSLGYVAERNHGGLSGAGLYFSYLGCAIARVQKRNQEALALCEHAVKVEFYQPENWANLAEVLLLSGKRPEAIEAVLKGLEFDAQNERLHELHGRLGLRRRPVLSFLARSNPINYLLGKLRTDMFGPPKR